MNAWKWLLLALLTLALCSWTALLASQRNVLLMLAAFLGTVWLTLLVARRRLSNRWGLGAVGLLAGYMGMVFAAAVGELAMRGADFFVRSFANNLYFFPSLSLGWLYGALAFWVVGGRVDQPMGPGQAQDFR